MFDYRAGVVMRKTNDGWRVDAGHKRTGGYVHIRVAGRPLQRSRLVWIWHNGRIPAGMVIDHINGVRDDDRIENLRCVTISHNQRNTKMRSDNTSGVVGVNRCPKSGKWRADIRVGGYLTCLGMFTDFNEAVAVRKAAEKHYGFHPNHGRKTQEQSSMLYEAPKPLKRHMLTLKQLAAITRLTLINETMLVAPVGFGKAVTGLTAACDRIAMGASTRILVIAPKRVCELVWGQEADKWDHIRYDVALALGTPKQRRSAALSRAPIVVVNIENAVWMVKEYGELFDGMIIDELTKGKSVGGTLASGLRKWVKTLNWRVGMSATPFAEDPTDAYGQCLLLDLGKALGTRKAAFLDQYFMPDGYVPYGQPVRKWIPKPGAIAAMTKAMSNLVYKVDGDAVLPELVHIEHMIALPGAARALYETMAEHSVAMGVAAGSEAIKASKLRQIASGGLYGEDGELVWYDPFRIDAAVALINSADSPILVVYEYAFQLQYLRAHYPDAPVLGDGQKFGQKELDAWSAGQVPVVLLHVRSAGHGLNLQYGGHTMLIITPIWGSDPFKQVVGRIHRRGQTAPKVVIHEMLAHGTSDLRFRDRLDDKAAAEQEMMALIE